MKITRFRDVPQYTRDGSYQIDLEPDRLLVWIADQQKESKLDIDPDFQRPHCWTTKQQSAYIEFFLKGGKTAKILYFNCPSWHLNAKTDYNDFVLVDGKQRLEAWRRFIHNEIKVFGSKFSEFTDTLRMSQTVKVNVNDLQSKAEVLQWYLDFNSGGVVHSEEELTKVRRLLVKEKKIAKV